MDLWQAVNRRSKVQNRMVPAVAEPLLLPWRRRPLPRRHLQPPLPAPPPHFAKAAELPQDLWEQALAVSTLAVAGLLAHREDQEGPSPPHRRLARALLASCRTMVRCARERVARGFR